MTAFKVCLALFPGARRSACGITDIPADFITIHRDRVTCGNCRRTRAFRGAPVGKVLPRRLLEEFWDVCCDLAVEWPQEFLETYDDEGASS